MLTILFNMTLKRTFQKRLFEIVEAYYL